MFSASEVTTLRRYTNLFIIIVVACVDYPTVFFVYIFLILTFNLVFFNITYACDLCTVCSIGNSAACYTLFTGNLVTKALKYGTPCQ